MKSSIRSAKTAPFFIVLLVVTFFGVDIFTPLGVADWLLYSVPMLLTLWAQPYVRPTVLASICTVLIVLGLIFSPPGLEPRYAALNRLLCIVNIWAMAIIVQRRGRAEVEFVSQKRHLDELIDSVEGIVWEADAETFRFSFVSPQAERLLGYPASTWMEERNFFSRHLHPDDRKRVLEGVAELVRTNKRGELDYRFIAANGTTIWIRDMVNVAVVDGRPRLRGIMVDVTERKRAEEERQQHVWMLESMDRVDRAIQGTSDLENMMARVLDEVLAIFECDRAWLCHPCDPDSPVWSVPMERTRPEYPGAFACGETFAMEPGIVALIQKLRTTNGVVRFDPESSNPIASGLTEQFQVRSMLAMTIYPKLDKPYAFGLHQCSHARVWKPQEERVFQEIGHRLADALTALLAYRNLRQTEDYFHSLTDNIDEVFWMTDAGKTKTLYISPAYEKIWGRSCQSLYEKPLSWLESVHPDDRERVQHAMATKQKDNAYDEEYRIECPDGGVRWVRDQAFTVRNENGQIERILGVARDITERRLLSEQLRQSQKMEAVGQLAGGVAHDFNNILTVIRGNADLALMELPEAASGTHDFLKQIISAADRAANLTGQLLMFGRRQVMQLRELDLNEVVTSVAKMLQRMIGEDVRLRLNLKPGSAFVHADSGMLDQVLMNLAVNARDAMPSGGMLIIETAKCVVDEAMSRLIPDSLPGHYIRLSVSDTGQGIPKEILPRIFEPFFTTKEPGKGTGLGLATVFGIVKQHHGWIKVYSEAGKGTHFQIFLPVSERSRAAVTEAQPAPARGGTETILLVEDDAAVRHLTRVTLERNGYHILVAENGPEAITVWSENTGKIALLVTDVVMPHGMSGHALARELRQRRPDLKVIFTSGYSAEMAGKQLELDSNETFLQKPYPPNQLLREIRRCLDE